jgi:UDP-N-acetylglucosamine 2-epimerase (non-hydrolysing)
MKILTVVGARPNFMKVAPIIAAINSRNRHVAASALHSAARPADLIQHVLVHTGQHYDDRMSGAFFTDLDLSKPDVWLGVGSGSHAAQTAEIMKKFEGVVLAERPDVVVVVGDVNSTVACALVTAKMSFDSGGSRPVIAHVEAGLRSFDRSMPEEINRIVTDHLSDLLFATEESGIRNLRDEGVSLDKVHFVGNTMIDSLLTFKEKAESSQVLEALGLRTREDAAHDTIADYALLTLHRPSNVDDRDTFLNILAGLDELGAACPIVFPVHPRTQRRIGEFGLDLKVRSGEVTAAASVSGSQPRGIVLIDPLGYLDFLCVMKHARLVVTDSGGIQEETTCLGIPCVTVRENTERPVTVEFGTNVIAGTDEAGIRAGIRQQMRRRAGGSAPAKWDGQAAARIVDVLADDYGRRTSRRDAVAVGVC